MIRAAVFDGPGKPFRFETFPRPTLGPGEVLVRVTLCTVCGSDLHTVGGRRTGPTPCVLGHEAVGMVEGVGDGACDVAGVPLRVGDRVVWAVAAICGRCFFCTHRLPQKCESLRKYGHDRLTQTSGPHGGYATHCHLFAGSTVVRVPGGLPDAVAAPAACATATVMAAYREALNHSTGDRFPRCVVIFGLGMLGLTACAVASVGEASVVVGADIDAARLVLAARFGATHPVRLPTDGVGLLAQVKELTAGRGADLALELSGSPIAAGLSLEVLRIGGTAIWLGAVLPTGPVPVNPEQIVRKCLTLKGVHNYAPPDLDSAITFLASHHRRFPFADLVAQSFPLSEIDIAFRNAAADRPVRVGLIP